MKLLQLEYDSADQLTGVRMLEAPQESPDSGEKAEPPAKEASSGHIPADLLSPQEAQQLLFICEQYLGKTLSSREVAQILDLHDSLGFSAELIEYLVEYCVSGGHKSIHYIEGTARGWCQDGIRTVSQARQQTTTYNRAYYKILKAFGISSRNPVEVETAFMNKWLKTWGFSLELHQALSKSPIRVILPRNEQGGAFGADGFARMSGEVGVCMATSGPGATNLLTGVADCYMDSIPVVFITGQVPADMIGKNVFQETDIIGMTRPVVKHSYLVLDAADIPRILREAFYLAKSGRPGPVLVDIPKNVQQQIAMVDLNAEMDLPS